MYKRILNPSKTLSVFLFGARSTGKSTLINQIFSEENSYFINLLNPSLFNKLDAFPEQLKNMIETPIKENKFIIIDEIQKAPALLDLVHLYIQTTKAKFILTGSSVRKLKRSSANMLAGRASIYKLYPLLYSELENDFDLNRALTWGTLPEIPSLKKTKIGLIFYSLH